MVTTRSSPYGDPTAPKLKGARHSKDRRPLLQKYHVYMVVQAPRQARPNRPLTQGEPVDTLIPPVYPSALDGACPPPPHAPFTHLTLYPRKGLQTIPSNIQVPLVLPALRPPTHPSLTPIRATTRLHSTWIGLSGQGEGGACGRGGRAKKK